MRIVHCHHATSQRSTAARLGNVVVFSLFTGLAHVAACISNVWSDDSCPELSYSYQNASRASQGHLHSCHDAFMLVVLKWCQIEHCAWNRTMKQTAVWILETATFLNRNEFSIGQLFRGNL